MFIGVKKNMVIVLTKELSLLVLFRREKKVREPGKAMYQVTPFEQDHQKFLRRPETVNFPVFNKP